MMLEDHRDELLKYFEDSEPVDEYDDRNHLYSIKTQLMHSAHVSGMRVRTA